MATKKKSSSLGQILKNEGFEALLEKVKGFDDKEYNGLTSTKENTPGSEKFISDLDELLFHTSEYFYVKDDEGNNTQLPAPGVFEFIDWAIENGASPNISLKYGVSMFLKAATMKEPTLIRYLIENTNTDIHQKDGRGLDAIMYSVRSNSRDTFEYLYETNEFDINHKYPFIFDKTLLHAACSLANEEFIDRLLELGADLASIDTKGLYPKDMIPTKYENDLPEEDVTDEKIAQWDALADKLDKLTTTAISSKAKKKIYRTSF